MCALCSPNQETKELNHGRRFSCISVSSRTAHYNTTFCEQWVTSQGSNCACHPDKPTLCEHWGMRRDSSCACHPNKLPCTHAGMPSPNLFLPCLSPTFPAFCLQSVCAFSIPLHEHSLSLQGTLVSNIGHAGMTLGPLRVPFLI